jgi:branched-chain amino acid aminotransferase
MFTAKIRHFSTSIASFYHKDLVVTTKPTVKPNFANAKLGFGSIATDHMLSIDHDGKRGWKSPEIVPFAPISIHPFNSTLHYGLCCFEGMKAFKGKDGSVRLFRPMENMKRFLGSNLRLAFPEFDPAELLKLIEELVKIEKNWIPDSSVGSLYIRPVAFSMTDVLGVHRAPDTKILVMACPVGAYFDGKINLSVYENYWRGSPKSAASYKIGANYAPTVLIGDELAKQGYSQAVWVYNDCFLESGATNLFFVLENAPGQYEIVTHPLDGSILPGVIRDSIINLAPDIFPNIKISQRPFSIPEFIELHNNKKVKEIFVSGTASVIGEVHSLEIRGQVYPMDYQSGEKLICSTIKKHLLDIQFGVIPHPYSHIVQ